MLSVAPSLPDTRPLIAHIIHRLQAGGMENGLVNLINQLPQEEYRHAIVCLTDSTDFAKRIRARGASIHCLHKRAGKDPGTYLRFWRLMRMLRPTIVHTRNLGTLDLMPVALSAGVPSRIHGEHGWEISDISGHSKKYRLLRKCCNPAVNQYIAVSNDIERWLEDYVGIPAKKIQQIYNGVDADIFKPDGPRADLPFKACEEPPIVIGTVGRLDPIKGMHVLIAAVDSIVRDCPSIKKRLRLVIVGDGPLLSSLGDTVRKSAIRDLVWFAGNRNDIPNILRCLDVFVLASTNEGISNTIIESMATGLPVVATDVGGNRELVSDGETGCLVPANAPEHLAAGLLRYVNDEKLRKRHGNAARQRAKKMFGLTSMVTNYARIYDRFLNTRNMTGPGKN